MGSTPIPSASSFAKNLEKVRIQIMNMDRLQTPTPEKKPSRDPEKIPVEQTLEQRIMEIWETTIDPSIQHLVCETSREEFRKEVESGKFNQAQVERLIVFRRYFKVYKKSKKDSPALDLDNDPKRSVPSSGNNDLDSLWDTEGEEAKGEKPSETETLEALKDSIADTTVEEMRIATLTQAIEKKLPPTNKQKLAEEITSLFMNNGFDFIERQIQITARGDTRKITRFIIFLDPHKKEKWKKQFAKSVSGTFKDAVPSFNRDFRNFQRNNENGQIEGVRLALDKLVRPSNNGKGWYFASQEDAEAILKYLRDNNKLLEEKDKKSYAMYMDPNRANVSDTMISIGRESGGFTIRKQDAYLEPKHEQEVVFWATPVLTIDIEENGIKKKS